jgi:hypothetical protein
MLGIIAHRIADLFYGEVQGGFENMAHSLIIDKSFFTSTHVKKWGNVCQRLFIIAYLRSYYILFIRMM